MITILDYASLAAHVYNPQFKHVGTNIFQKLETENIKKNFSSSNVNFYRLPDVHDELSYHGLADDLKEAFGYGFHAELYVKFEQGQAVDSAVAFRGTVTSNFHNIATDLHSWAFDALGDSSLDAIPCYLNDAMSFVNAAEKYIARYFPYLDMPSVTGHSLGGALAQLLPLQAGYPTRAICFNSPGCGNLPGVERNRRNWVTNINAAYDFVSKIGLTLGPVSLVHVLDKEPEAKLLTDSFDKKDFDAAQAEFLQIANTQGTDATKSTQALNQSFHAYLQSLDKLNNTAELQGAYLQCKTVHERELFFRPWLRHTLQSNCNLHALVKEYAAVITAQHDINHMVAALQSEPAANVAYRSLLEDFFPLI